MDCRSWRTPGGLCLSVTVPANTTAAIGTVPETLSRLKDRLESRGVIEWSGRTIRLKEGFWGEREDLENIA